MIWDMAITISCEDLMLDIPIIVSVDTELADNGWRYKNTIEHMGISYEWPAEITVPQRTALVKALEPIIKPLIEGKLEQVNIRSRRAAC